MTVPAGAAGLTTEARPEGADTDRPGSAWALVAAAGAMVAAAAHLPVTPEHLREAPYMGVLFVAFSLAVLAGAAAVLLRDTAGRYASLGAVSLTAVVAYAATRLVAFPQLADDVGNWWEPLGVLSVLSEALVAAACLLGARAVRRERP